MSVTINISDNTDMTLEELTQRIEVGLEEIGVLAEGDAADHLELTPRRIDTGNLQNSITHIVNGRNCHVGTDVKYAGYVHDGTSKMAPNRFLTDMAENDRGDFVAIMKRALSE